MTNPRFIKSVTTTTKANATQLPWARGPRRTAFIAKRSGALIHAKSA